MMPTYNPKRDGNPFEWLLRAAAQVRAERVAERAMQAAKRPPAYAATVTAPAGK
jgi:hypothetical protein